MIWDVETTMEVARDLVAMQKKTEVPLEIMIAAYRIAAEACQQELNRQALVAAFHNAMRPK